MIWLHSEPKLGYFEEGLLEIGDSSCWQLEIPPSGNQLSCATQVASTLREWGQSYFLSRSIKQFNWQPWFPQIMCDFDITDNYSDISSFSAYVKSTTVELAWKRVEGAQLTTMVTQGSTLSTTQLETNSSSNSNFALVVFPPMSNLRFLWLWIIQICEYVI